MAGHLLQGVTVEKREEIECAQKGAVGMYQISSIYAKRRKYFDDFDDFFAC
jgi:hypothetical protein